jgi:hypothetical protein
MQTHGGAEAEAAITAADKTIRAEVKVDWFRGGNYDHFLSDLSPFVDNIVVDRSLAGAAPAEIMLVEGNSAAQLEFEIGGELTPGQYGSLKIVDYMNLVAVFSPYNGVSPLYNLDPVGAEVTYRLGVDTVIGTIWYPQFIGNIRTITPMRGENKVVFSALDRVEKLRKPITHTDWGILDLQANQGFITSQLMHAHWMIDHCLKNCDVSSSPYRWQYSNEIQFSGDTDPDSKTQIYISGNGSHAPNVGWVDGSNNNQFPDTDRNPALTMLQERGQAHPSSPDPTMRPQGIRAQRDWGNDFNVYWGADKNDVLSASQHTITFTLHTEDWAGAQWFLTMADAAIMSWDTKDQRQIQVWVGAGQMWLRYVDNAVSGVWTTAKITIPTGVGNEYVRCTAKLQYGNGGLTNGERMQLLVGSTVGAWVPMQALRSWSQTTNIGRFLLWRKLAFQDVAVVTYDYFLTPTHATTSAKYPAVLDRSLNRLSFLPKRWGALAWDVIAELAAAEFGAVLWDENGIFRFWNQDTILAKKEDFVRTLTLDEVSGLEMTVSTDSIRNIFSIAAKRARVQNVRVYETTGPDELYLPPGQFTEVRVWVDNIVTPDSAQIPTYEPETSNGPLPKWSEYVNFGLLAQQWNGSAWEDVLPASPWLGFMYRVADGATMVRMWNGFANPVRFADPGGGAAFRWDGSKLTMFDDQAFVIKDQASIDRWGSQGLELSSDWYQEFFEYGSFFDKMLTRTSQPIPATDSVTIAGDPRLQLGDAIKVQDPDGFGEDMRLQILGIRRSYSRDAGLVDDLTVELTAPPRVGLWDSAQYGVWDASFIWSD